MKNICHKIHISLAWPEEMIYIKTDDLLLDNDTVLSTVMDEIRMEVWESHD